MTLSTRLMAAMVMLVLVCVAIIGGFTYRNIEALILPRALARLESQALLVALGLEASLRGARADALGFQASDGIARIVQASLAPAGSPERAALPDLRARLAGRFSGEMAAKPNYAEFRVIGIADGGREIVRVDRGGPNESIRVATDGELRQMGERDYFRNAVRLRPGEADVSPVELDRERGASETPRIPILRAAAAIRAPDGQPFGIVVIDVDLRTAFARIRAAADGEGAVYLVNAQGDYLVHDDRSREFGFEFGRPQRVQDDFPGLAGALTGPRAARLTPDTAGARFGVAVAPVHLAEGPVVAVVRTLSYPQLMAPAIAVRNSTLLAGLAAVLVAIGFAVVLARTLSRPLAAMTSAVEAFGRGEPMTMPTQAAGEIGTLSRAFARMAHDVQEKSDALTQEIDERQQLFETSLDLVQVARGIVDTALDAFVQMDETGTIVEWNQHAEAMFGWSRAEAVGRPLAATIIPPTRRADHAGGLARFLKTGESVILGKRFETDAVTRDGHEFKVEIAVTALRRRSGYVFNGFIRDLTDKIAAEAQLRQSQKMDAVGQLTGGVAHDFNNILTVITGTVEILIEGVADRPQLAAIARMIDEAATRGAALTQQLLAFARRQPLQPVLLDPNPLMIDTAGLLRPTLGEQIEVEAMLEDDVWPVVADAAQLGTALINLAINSRDAMPNGGKLTLETANVMLDEAYAEANPEVRAGPYVMIAVSDTGVGIPPALLEKVFEPFFTTKDIGKGTGLGLSMVYGFVRQSGGHIKIYSEQGHGTSIKIYLPRAKGEAELPANGASVAARGGNETILVVEDDALVRDYVVAQLRSLGYATLAAGSGAAAVALVDSGAQFDLLFTDVIMPGGMNGRELAEAIARRRPGTRVLYTSGYTENAIVHHGRLDPGVTLLNKPYRKRDLAQKLREVLDASSAAA